VSQLVCLPNHLIPATQILGLASFWDETYIPTQWQVYLLDLALLSLIFGIVLSLPTKIKHFETFICMSNFFKLTKGYWCLVGFVIVFITVLSCHHNGFSENSFVWNNAQPLSGWNPGLGFIMGSANSMFTYGAIDAATHMAEELPSPSINVPKSMILTIIIGFLTAWPMVCCSWTC
jgi:choline transport protein